MGEEKVTITFNFNSKEISVKIDPALLDAVEQEMKLYGLTSEEVLSFGFSEIFRQYPLDKIIDMDLNQFGIIFPAEEYAQEMSISEFIDLKSTDSEIRSKQIDLLHNRKRNIEFISYVHNQGASALQKRLDWVRKNKK